MFSSYDFFLEACENALTQMLDKIKNGKIECHYAEHIPNSRKIQNQKMIKVKHLNKSNSK